MEAVGARHRRGRLRRAHHGSGAGRGPSPGPVGHRGPHHDAPDVGLGGAPPWGRRGAPRLARRRAGAAPGARRHGPSGLRGRACGRVRVRARRHDGRSDGRGDARLLRVLGLAWSVATRILRTLVDGASRVRGLRRSWPARGLCPRSRRGRCWRSRSRSPTCSARRSERSRGERPHPSWGSWWASPWRPISHGSTLAPAGRHEPHGARVRGRPVRRAAPGARLEQGAEPRLRSRLSGRWAMPHGRFATDFDRDGQIGCSGVATARRSTRDATRARPTCRATASTRTATAPTCRRRF